MSDGSTVESAQPFGVSDASGRRTVESLDPHIERAAILIEALPYILTLKDKVVVIKLGGAAIKAADVDAVLRDIVLLHSVGMKPVIVHGGGPEISAMQEERGITPRFIEGLRVTDEQTMEIVKTALAERIGPDLSARIGGLGGSSFSLPGHNGPVIRVTKHVPENGADLGFVGRIHQIDIAPIEAIMARGAIPILQSLGRGLDGQVYNVNADDAASEIAIAMRAMKFMLCTDQEGVRGDTGEICSELDTTKTEALIANGTIEGGMIPKVRSALHAAEHGCAAHIIDGRLKHALLLELLTDVGVGTMLHAAGRKGIGL